VLRTALQPKFLALLALALALATAFAWLGDWQLGRARDKAAHEVAAEAAERHPVDIAQVLQPATALTGKQVRRVVHADGDLDTTRLLRVPDRRLDGEDGSWLLAPLRVDAGGGTLPVVLGWLPAGAVPPALPNGHVRLTGHLEQSEAPTGVTAPASQDGVPQVPAVSSADLVNLWQPPLYTAYLAVSDPAPAAPLRAVPASTPSSGFALQNLSYALQWWLFAGFAVFFWWRQVRDAHERRHEDETPKPTAPATATSTTAPTRENA
jgi:cytochrome oxidase assembly protein ShyY1